MVRMEIGGSGLVNMLFTPVHRCDHSASEVQVAAWV